MIAARAVKERSIDPQNHFQQCNDWLTALLCENIIWLIFNYPCEQNSLKFVVHRLFNMICNNFPHLQSANDFTLSSTQKLQAFSYLFSQTFKKFLDHDVRHTWQLKKRKCTKKSIFDVWEVSATSALHQITCLFAVKKMCMTPINCYSILTISTGDVIGTWTFAACCQTILITLQKAI